MRTTRWARMAVLASVLWALCGATRASTTISGGTAEQRSAARWALNQYAGEGFALPRLDIRLHPDRQGCRGWLGYFESGVVDVCAFHSMDMARRTLLHEMAHGWTSANVTDAQMARFLELRGLATWNDQAVPWEERGFEQAAEIIAWAMRDQDAPFFSPSIPDRSFAELSQAYRLLTDQPLPVMRNRPA